MLAGSSLVPKNKMKGQNPSSLMLKKRQTKMSVREMEEAAHTGPSRSGVMESTKK